MSLYFFLKLCFFFLSLQKKIDKRGRKLVDYDSQRHNFQSLQCNPKKRDELKVTRGKELLDEAKRTYEQLNSELHDELPALYDSRVLFLVTNLQTLFAAEQVFHAESAKVSILFFSFLFFFFFYTYFEFTYFFFPLFYFLALLTLGYKWVSES